MFALEIEYKSTVHILWTKSSFPRSEQSRGIIMSLSLSLTSSGSLCSPMAGKSPPGGEGISWVPISLPEQKEKSSVNVEQ